jgi:hypothetical protein
VHPSVAVVAPPATATTYWPAGQVESEHDTASGSAKVPTGHSVHAKVEIPVAALPAAQAVHPSVAVVAPPATAARK